MPGEESNDSQNSGLEQNSQNNSESRRGTSFEFRTTNASVIFNYLTRAFTQDYMVKRLPHMDSGWRSLGDISKDLRVPSSIIYAKKRNQLSPPVKELMERGLIERRFFQSERGRGGEVMRLRIAYENEIIKHYVETTVRTPAATSKNASIPSSYPAQSPPKDRNDIPIKVWDKHRIAVLPFTNISPDPKDEYFTDGMTEELISTLSRIRELRVISRTSVMQYKRTEKSVSEIANELNVSAILEGSVRKMGDDLRINAQLIDVQNDEHLWSEDYDRKFENVFSLQREIAQRVANSLKISILAGEKGEMSKWPTQNLGAYTLYLKGRSYRHRVTLESFNKTIEYCKKALEIDPKYAQAYAEIARCYTWIGLFQYLPADEAFSTAEIFAEKAMQLDDTIPESYLALGAFKLHRWDFQEAELAYRHALELNPSLADGHLELSGLLTIRRRWTEAILESNRALELDPLSPSTCTNAGTWLAICREYDKAIELLNNVIELDPNSALAHDNLGYTYVMKGMIDQGISEIKKSIELGGGIMQQNDLAHAYARAGRMDEVRKILEDLLRLREKGQRTDTAIGGVYVSLGDYDKAVNWLEKAYEDHLGYFLAINCESTFDPLRSDPRFLALLKKVGF